MAGDLTDILRDWGKLDERGLSRAQGLTQVSGEPLHLILCRLGLVGEADMAKALAENLELPLVGEANYPARPVLADRVATSFLRTSRVLPLADGADAVAVAMADPLDRYAVEALELLLEKPVARWVAVPADLDRQIERLYGDGTAAAAPGAVDAVDSADIERLKDMASEVPVVRLVNQMIAEAVAARASDIHIEPQEGELRLRLRIDGMLRPVKAPPAALHAGIVSRIKIMASLNIVERRLPQDGRCKVNVQGREIDIRVSCVPAMHGESVALRILDKASAPLDLDRLGFDAVLLDRLRDLLDRATGILLVTGPTGSGKTTTLYAALQRLNTAERKIVTVEDPIEYQLPGVNQIQVRPRIGLGFANILRSVLRHDPDVIMIGEIRDLETARIAMQASLTGHLVLSTLHTNSAAGAVTRLADMGVEPYLITSTVRGIVAQRLLRTLCAACREAYEAPPEMLRALGIEHPASDPAPSFQRAPGCAKCGETGYDGRTGVSEMLTMSETIRALVLDRADALDIERVACAEGMQSMRLDGLGKVRAGVTTVEEVLRVTQEG